MTKYSLRARITQLWLKEPLFFLVKHMLAESLKTTKSRLLEANSPTEVDQEIKGWREVRDGGDIIAAGVCSDARLILPKMAYLVRTISATGPRSPWHSMFKHEKVGGILILTHFDCGGMKAKAGLRQRDQAIEEDEEALCFVKDHVWHRDPVFQAISTGSWTAYRTDKPVVAAVQDHLDGQVYIQGIFNGKNQSECKTIPTYLLMSRKYLHEDIYENGRPQLDENLVPPIFRHCLEEIRVQSSSLIQKYPNFRERQSVQDPEFIVLSTITKPLSIRFKRLFSEPGAAFVVNLRRQFNESNTDLPDNEDVSRAFMQLNYPLYKCLNREGDSYSPFQSSRVLYIETGRMEDSRRLADQAIRKGWVKDWLKLPEREIVVSEVVAGYIRNIDRVA